jgi:site-specific DNA-methyltransferase (adenine-specific)
MLGDCLERMKEIESGSVDMILTDPPYNIAQKNNFKSMGRAGIDFGEWDKGFDQKKWLLSLSRVTSKNATLVIFNTFQNLTDTQRILEDEGFIYKDFLVMEKSNPMPRNRDRRYINACEYALVMVKRNSKWVFNRLSDKYDSNVMKTSVVSGKEKTRHTTQKPINVIRDLVARHSNEGQVILDPFMGSGTTGVACVNTSRDFIGIEMDEGYFEIAKDRINNNMSQ